MAISSLKDFFRKPFINTELVILVVIILLTLLLRLYNISGHMNFLGDEGRDALVVEGMLVNHHIPLIGPPTSIGNMYLGPLYYYMMAIPMAIWWLNPVAAAVMVAFIGTLSVILIFYLAKKWFGIEAAIVSSLLYSISPVNIIYSHSSWNPNPAPFFALLSILGLFKAHQSKNFSWLILSGGALAFAVQMHYLALILLPVAGILWLYELLLRIKFKTPGKHFVSSSFFSIILFLGLMSPLALFDLRHNFMNAKAVLAFFSDRGTTVNLNPLNSLARVYPIYTSNLISRYLAGQDQIMTIVAAVLILLPLVTLLVRKLHGKAVAWSYFALYTWLIIGVVGLSLYKQTIYDHYLGFLNPTPYILLGSCLALAQELKSKIFRNILKIGVFLVVVILVIVNLKLSPLLSPPNNELQRTQDVSKFIINEASGQPFNFALLSAHNYDAAYQFYLGIYKHPPLKVPSNKTDQLFVVCEDPICQPINNPKYEIAAFGMSKIDQVWDIEGVKVFRLIPNISGKPM